MVVGIDNEAKLHKTLDKVRELGFRCFPFFEADLDNQLTAFATEPVFEPDRAKLRRFNLLKFAINDARRGQIAAESRGPPKAIIFYWRPNERI